MLIGEMKETAIKKLKLIEGASRLGIIDLRIKLLECYPKPRKIKITDLEYTMLNQLLGWGINIFSMDPIHNHSTFKISKLTDFELHRNSESSALIVEPTDCYTFESDVS